MLRNSRSEYGRVSIAVHWLSAVVIIAQFCLGLYMLSLDYYDANYKILPYYHKSIGILFGGLLVFRIVWMFANPRPSPVPGVKTWEHRAARLVQALMLVLLIAVVIFGYLISTADGQAITVFNWFEVPATITSIENQEDWAGELHYWAAICVIVLASMHALAALKHHFMSRDRTLLRMLGKQR